MVAIERELTVRGLLLNRPEVGFTLAPLDAISRIHEPHLIGNLEATSGRAGWIDADTVAGPDSFEVARLAAGAAIAAVDAVIAGPSRRAFVIARPPGHHATPTKSMGFCLLNSVAIAAAHALHRGLDRVAILDWDVHHGNGTQDAFYERSDVLFVSLHRAPFYPGTGASSETGAGAGKGFTLNIPLLAGTGDATYLHHMRNVVVPAIDAFAPELLLVSAGYDAHVDDPLGGMAVTESGFQAFTRVAIDLANRLCGGRLVLILEGGYDPPALARCVADAVEQLDTDNIPAGGSG
jgi:acetoin utilization deacetylase AcuC-like enzyme